MAARGQLDPLTTGVIRWAWHKSREHMRTVFLGGLVVGLLITVIGAVVQQPTHASGLSRGVHAGTLFLSVFGAIAFLAYVYAFARAPYQQRDALRMQIHEQVAAASEQAAKPNLDVQPVGPMQFSITNKGRTDHFKMIVGEGNGGRPMPWGYDNSGDKKMVSILEKLLVTDEHAFVDYYGWPKNDEFSLRILSRESGSLHLRFSVRETRLKVREMKYAHDEWPERDEAWRSRIEWLLSELRPLPEKFADVVTVNDEGSQEVHPDRLTEIVNTFSATCTTKPVVVGQEFAYACAQNEPKDIWERIDHHRECITRSIAELDACLARGTDAV